MTLFITVRFCVSFLRFVPNFLTFISIHENNNNISLTHFNVLTRDCLISPTSTLSKCRNWFVKINVLFCIQRWWPCNTLTTQYNSSHHNVLATNTQRFTAVLLLNASPSASLLGTLRRPRVKILQRPPSHSTGRRHTETKTSLKSRPLVGLFTTTGLSSLMM